MKLNPAWILGSGGIYHDHYPFLLSHIPCIHLWSGHYSCPFPEQLQRGSRDQEPPYRKSGTQYSTLMPIQREYWFGGVIYHD